MAEIIAYFSRKYENYVGGEMKNLSVGNTEIAAGMIHEFTEADMFEMKPVQEYSKSYNECIAEAQADQRRNARPELKCYPDSLDGYDTVYLGYPNYWGTMPMAVFTFLEHFDFAGKRIFPFCTHEGSGMGNSVADIRRLCPGADVEQGLAVYGRSVQNSKDIIEQWLKENGRI